MSIAASILLLPAPDASWRVWKPRTTGNGEAVETPSTVSNQGKPLVVGLPATACRTIGLVLPNADHAVLEQIIITQLERRGLRLDPGPARNFRWHLLTQSASTATVSVDVLADPFPQDLALTQASDFTAALRLVSLPSGHIVITEEHGSLVLAAGYQGKLYHSHLFAPASAPPEEIVQEVMLSRLALEADLGQGSLTALTLVGLSWDAQVIELLGFETGLPVRQVGQLPPNSELDTRSWTRLLPAAVHQAQNSKARRGRLVRYSILGGLVLLSLAFLAFASLSSLEAEAVSLQAAVNLTAEPAAQVKKTAERWRALAPAVDKRRYPMVLLSEMTKLMPPSGIVIREFEVRDNDIDIRGEARDAQMAFQFVEDLQKHPILGRFTWTKPQPTVREKTAQFRAQGKAQ